jgi:lysosomal acid lipase/cholesteryl ester hydrolase
MSSLAEEEKEEKNKGSLSSSSSSSSLSSKKNEKEKENQQKKEDLDYIIKNHPENEDNKKGENKEQEKIEQTFSQKIKNFFKKPKEISPENPLLKDENRTLEEIITSKNFKCEKHFVKTEDGYTLVLFRIPGGKNCEDGSKLPPVLLQHGVFDSSDGWVCNGEEHSIAFVLANKNFDVWLGNSRGNKYCKTHDKFDDKSFEFWQFSFNELGMYDEPAIIKYIREVNKSGEKIIYFGHSQGTSLMFGGIAQKFDFYKENIKLFVALAPVARLSNLASSLLSFLSTVSMHKMMKKAKVFEMCPNTDGTKKLMNFMEKHAVGLTNFFLGLISDSNSKECNDQNSLAVYLKHYPCGSSLKCLIHYVQIIKAKKFVYFNYGKEANFAIYHQIEPPEYDLSIVKDFPIILIGGEKDKLAPPNDVIWLKEALGNNVIYYKIIPKMGHISFMCGKDFSWFDEPLKIIMNEYYPRNEELKTD